MQDAIDFVRPERGVFQGWVRQSLADSASARASFAFFPGADGQIFLFPRPRADRRDARLHRNSSPPLGLVFSWKIVSGKARVRSGKDLGLEMPQGSSLPEKKASRLVP